MNLQIFCLAFIIAVNSILCLKGTAQSTSHTADEIIVMLQPSCSLEEFLSRTPAGITLQHKQTLSTRLNIHLLHIQTQSGILEFKSMQLLRVQPDVCLAQFNHYIQRRSKPTLIPNDTLFQRQWNMENTGQNGGEPDADIDATDAWDITTGGTSTHGDRIVIAVIDEGFDIDHPDVPWWTNTNEIPDNGIDDDNNGFIDDVAGWNAVDDIGDIPVELHGTHVSGIAAANGNNLTGVAGVTWDTQLLPIVGFDLTQGGRNTEATVVKAYSYIYEMRALYNETRGARGAFIVSTNTSFGIERGRPADYPIWCAMYDSLGTLGILNSVATTNATRDVDEQGDIPSLCPSDYLLVTTQTNRQDLKNSGSQEGGTGPIHVDIAAPGEQILSTSINQGYSLLSGTSMAAPHVAGAIALMVAAACPNLLATYKNAPETTAKLLRRLILQSADPIDTLQGRILSGGRLNAYQSLLRVDSICQNFTSDCGLTYFLQADAITDSSATLSWNPIDNADSYTLRWRPLNSEQWNEAFLEDTQFLLTGLVRCTAYEYQINTICSNESSGFTNSLTFTTEGCCEPPTLVDIQQIEAGVSSISWNTVFGADSFEVQIRPEDSTTWISYFVSDTSLLADTLLNCQFYELRLRTFCDTLVGEFSDITTFRTKDCGLCVEGAYCESEGDTPNISSAEWIEEVRIGPLVNTSGNNQGYGAFLFDSVYTLTAGLPYPIELTPGFESNAFQQYWLIWIDINRNGVFDEPEEIVFDTEAISSQVIRDTITLSNVTEGNTRLRVSMRFLEAAPVCGNFLNGEVEDYCVQLEVDSTICLPPSDLEVNSLSATEASFVIEDKFNADEFLFRYRPMDQNEAFFMLFEANQDSFTLPSLLPCTGYIVQVAKLCNGDTSAFSPSTRFLTRGCGTCTEATYCNVMASSSRDEWIQRIEIDGNQFVSGNNQGLGNFDYVQFFFRPGEKLPFRLDPEFAGDVFAENWGVWIDWNQNGDFEDNEERVFITSRGTTRPVSDSITVPDDAAMGITRMRIMMQFGQPPQVCENPDFGEVEEYCVVVSNSTSSLQELSEMIHLYPNPVNELLQVESLIPIKQIEVINLQGKIIENIPYPQDTYLDTHKEISTYGWSNGMYLIEIQTIRGNLVRKIWKK